MSLLSGYDALVLTSGAITAAFTLYTFSSHWIATRGRGARDIFAPFNIRSAHHFQISSFLGNPPLRMRFLVLSPGRFQLIASFGFFIRVMIDGMELKNLRCRESSQDGRSRTSPRAFLLGKLSRQLYAKGRNIRPSRPHIESFLPPSERVTEQMCFRSTCNQHRMGK